jgi:hypothetical protein
MSSSDQSPPQNQFDMANVSIGFVWSLQDSVLRLEQNQQHLIAQLEHANGISTEFYEKSVIYHRKYDEALREMEILRRKHEMDTQLLSQKIEHAKQDAQTERAIRQIHEEQLVLLERQVAQQVNYAAISQATTIHGNEDCSYDREILSPVSVASPSPRASRYGQHSPRLEPETPNSGADEDEDDDNETEREFQTRYYCDSSSSQTTDCSGDPICHSDSDLD